MKWVRILVLILVAGISSLFPSIVLADTSATVTITATGWIGTAPTGLVITYINDFHLDISWTPAANSTATMVRASYGHIPTDINDGYLVYYGAGNSASDTSVNLEDNGGTYYARAWAEHGGTFEPVGTSGFMENPSMMLIALIIMALGLTLAGFLRENKILAFGGAGAWMVLGGYAYTRFTTAWDVYYGLFFLCMALVIVCSLEPVLMREKPEPEVEEDRYDRLGKKMAKYDERMSKLDKIFGMSKEEARAKAQANTQKKKLARFSATGEL
jgi:hypothetical protein